MRISMQTTHGSIIQRPFSGTNLPKHRSNRFEVIYLIHRRSRPLTIVPAPWSSSYAGNNHSCQNIWRKCLAVDGRSDRHVWSSLLRSRDCISTPPALFARKYGKNGVQTPVERNSEFEQGMERRTHRSSMYPVNLDGPSISC
nr:hypothetical protein CFP56_19549 [Quercus suber]